jgi:WD40 repeat protein
MLASASSDHIIRLWETAAGAKKQTLKGHRQGVGAVAFSPDGQMLASASEDCTVRLWDTATGAKKQTLKGHTRGVGAVAFSPDGQMLASASKDHTVRLWDAATGAEKQTLVVHISITSLSFSNNGKYLKSDRGMLPLNSDSSDMLDHRAQQSCVIFVNKEWVTQDGQKILWLPPDYRATCTAIHNDKLVLGHRSGKVTFFEISPNFLKYG